MTTVDYDLLARQLASLGEGETQVVSVLANASALIAEALPDVSWVGFYLKRGGELVLGPFQGKVACMHIGWGKGVCGTAAALDQTQLVPDVHAFPGHIACDSASNSEVVVPIHAGDGVWGVLDLDSTSLARFDETDARGLEGVVAVFEELLPQLS
jgi:GAF domain-containing protein